MFRIRRFSVISTANTVAIMYFIGFLIIAIPLVLIFSLTQVTVTDASGRQATVAISLVFALLYNLTARFTGGIGVDVLSRNPTVVAAPPGTAYPPSQG